MAMRRIRRDGNSLVVTIPTAEANKAHLAEGAMVEIAANETTGQLTIQPLQITRRARPDLIAIGEMVITEDRELLERLAAYDAQAER